MAQAHIFFRISKNLINNNIYQVLLRKCFTSIDQSVLNGDSTVFCSIMDSVYIMFTNHDLSLGIQGSRSQMVKELD